MIGFSIYLKKYNTVNIFLICHDSLGQTLEKCVETSLGYPIEELTTIDVKYSDSLENIQKLIDTLWIEKGQPNELLALTDMRGASPSNALGMWLKTKQITYQGMTGVNLPMLICAVNHRNLPLPDLYSKVEEARDKSINKLD